MTDGMDYNTQDQFKSTAIAQQPSSPEIRMSPAENDAEKLRQWVLQFPACIVAFSGGVDSAVVAKAAQLSLNQNALAATANSPSLPAGELEAAGRLAAAIGIRHIVFSTDEMQRPEYVANTGDRCYWCKSELYEQMTQLPESAASVIFNGTNTDDLGDYRPGLVSAREHNVLSPLVECGLDKAAVRAVAKFWQLDVWDKPAGPCLASRIAPGCEVTPERLRMVDRSESFLRSLGFTTVRVRWHAGPVARIEVERDKITAITSQKYQSAIDEQLRNFGFRFVTIDLAGFRSGSLNDLIPVESLAGNLTSR